MKLTLWPLVVLGGLLAACSYDSSGLDGFDVRDGSVGVADSAIPGDPADAANPPPPRPDASPSPPIDAGVSLPPDASTSVCGASCVLAGGSCSSDVCVITCNGLNLCSGGVTCPVGVSCSVTCTGTNACAGGVACSGPKCTVKCDGTNACGNGGVGCDSPSCKIECRGDNACEQGVCCGPGSTSGIGGASCGNTCNDSMGGCCQCGGC
jgi:hypothetical protein